MSLRMPRERFTRQPWHCQSNTPHLNSRLREDWIKWMERHAKRSTSEFIASQLYSATCIRQRSPHPDSRPPELPQPKSAAAAAQGDFSWEALRTCISINRSQRSTDMLLPIVIIPPSYHSWNSGCKKRWCHCFTCFTAKKKLLLYWNWNNCNWKKVADWHRRLLAERLLNITKNHWFKRNKFTLEKNAFQKIWPNFISIHDSMMVKSCDILNSIINQWNTALWSASLNKKSNTVQDGTRKSVLQSFFGLCHVPSLPSLKQSKGSIAPGPIRCPQSS